MTEYQVIEGDETVYRDGTIKLHGPDGYEGMRKAGRLAAEILDELTGFVQTGVTTGEIDDKARTMMLDAGAVPATMGYRGYTHSCCTSKITPISERRFARSIYYAPRLIFVVDRDSEYELGHIDKSNGNNSRAIVNGVQ